MTHFNLNLAKAGHPICNIKYKFLKIYYYILYLITHKSKLKALYYATYMFFKVIRYDNVVSYGGIQKAYYVSQGMCFCIKEGLYKVFHDETITYSNMHNTIPEFNEGKALRLFNAIKPIGYWWYTTNIKDRYNYFKYLIKIYKNK